MREDTPRLDGGWRPAAMAAAAVFLAAALLTAGCSALPRRGEPEAPNVDMAPRWEAADRVIAGFYGARFRGERLSVSQFITNRALGELRDDEELALMLSQQRPPVTGYRVQRGHARDATEFPFLVQIHQAVPGQPWTRIREEAATVSYRRRDEEYLITSVEPSAWQVTAESDGYVLRITRPTGASEPLTLEDVPAAAPVEGEPRSVGAERFSQLSLAYDGQWLAFATAGAETSAFGVVPVVGGELTTEILDVYPGAEVQALRWSAGMGRIAVAYGDGGRDTLAVYAMDFGGGGDRARRLDLGLTAEFGPAYSLGAVRWRDGGDVESPPTLQFRVERSRGGDGADPQKLGFWRYDFGAERLYRVEPRADGDDVEG